MFDFLDGKTSIEQAYWIVALVGSVIFIFVLILTFLGGDADTDMEADAGDFDTDDGGVGFQFFTFKNFVAFFTIFGWTGLTCLQNGMSNGLTVLISTIAGLLMMVITTALFFWINKLAESGTLKMTNAIGKVGEVYLPIGANRSKMGKVQVNVQGSLRELEALTDNDEDLPTGSVVKVLDIINSEILLVDKYSK
ncbi:MAG: hypothetical protein CR968_00475 [Flavobacteriia bacterium]|nr:MAG: hypothetical protein CR968_00475 [Flavobacteriia bacterium]